MRRIAVLLVLVLMVGVWSVASGIAHGSTTQAAPAPSLEADFNNDGADDLAIGAPFEDIGSVLDAGAINVLYGSTAKLNATGNQQFFQGGGGLVGVAEEGDFVGAALASGDYNNDSFADLAVGVPFEDVGSVLDAGAVDTVNGSAGRLTATGGQQFNQGSGGVPGTPEEGDTFGSSLA
jgi:hypothetical protein